MSASLNKKFCIFIQPIPLRNRKDRKTLFALGQTLPLRPSPAEQRLQAEVANAATCSSRRRTDKLQYTTVVLSQP